MGHYAKKQIIEFPEVIMKFKVIAVALCAVCIAAFAIAAGTDADKSLIPPIITPGTASTQDKAGTAPSSAAGDVVVLFDDNDLSAWVSDKTGGPATWPVPNSPARSAPNRWPGPVHSPALDHHPSFWP